MIGHFYDKSLSPTRISILQRRSILNRVIHSYYEILLYLDIRMIMVTCIVLRGAQHDLFGMLGETHDFYLILTLWCIYNTRLFTLWCVLFPLQLIFFTYFQLFQSRGWRDLLPGPAFLYFHKFCTSRGRGW